MATVTTGFLSYREAELGQKAQHIVNSLTGNSNFPNPAPSLVDIQAALTGYQQALANLETGSKEATFIKNSRKTALVGLLNQLALHLQFVSQGDAESLLSSGFDLRKESMRVGPLTKPENFKVEPGVSPGSVKLSLKSIKGADSYLFEYTSAPVTADSVWQAAGSSRAQVVVQGLESGRQYVFRVTGIGADPTRVYSDQLLSYVL